MLESLFNKGVYCEIFEILKNIFFYRAPPVDASGLVYSNMSLFYRIVSLNNFLNSCFKKIPSWRLLNSRGGEATFNDGDQSEEEKDLCK